MKKVQSIVGTSIVSQTYSIAGKIIEDIEKGLLLEFIYDNQMVRLSFNMYISEQTIPWVESVGELMLDGYISEQEERKALEELFHGGICWDE